MGTDERGFEAGAACKAFIPVSICAYVWLAFPWSALTGVRNAKIAEGAKGGAERPPPMDTDGRR